MKQGDIALYSAFGRTLNALVIAVRSNEVSHLGKNGEPTLDLAFIDPARHSAIEKKQIGWQPPVIVEYGVVHASHEFPAEFKREKGILTPAQVATHRGQGEWKQAVVLNNEPSDKVDEQGMIAAQNRAVADPEPLLYTYPD